MTEWLTFISTLILAGITLWYVLLTNKIVKIQQEMLKVSNTPEIQILIFIKNLQMSMFMSVFLSIRHENAR